LYFWRGALERDFGWGGQETSAFSGARGQLAGAMASDAIASSSAKSPVSPAPWEKQPLQDAFRVALGVPRGFNAERHILGASL
jgi:hypothetical protein